MYEYFLDIPSVNIPSSIRIRNCFRRFVFWCISINGNHNVRPSLKNVHLELCNRLIKKIQDPKIVLAILTKNLNSLLQHFVFTTSIQSRQKKQIPTSTFQPLKVWVA